MLGDKVFDQTDQVTIFIIDWLHLEKNILPEINQKHTNTNNTLRIQTPP